MVPGSRGSGDFDITKIQTRRLTLTSASGTYRVGETVTQASSGATGKVFHWDNKNTALVLAEMSGVFDTTNVVSGGSSGAVGIPIEVPYAFPEGIRLSAIELYGSAANDSLIVRNENAVGAILFDRMDTTRGGVHQAVGGRSLRQKPFINLAECTFDFPPNARIRLEFD